MTRIWLFHIVLFSFLASATTGCNSEKGKEVAVIVRTKSYHTEACPRVNMAKTKFMTIAEARSLDCRPCPGCKPDAH